MLNYIKYIIFICFSMLLSFTSSTMMEVQYEKLNQEVQTLIYSGYLDRAEEKNNYLKSLSQNKNAFYYNRAILSSALIANFRGDNDSTIRYLNLVDEHENSLIIEYYYYDVFARYSFQTGQSQLGINYLIKTIKTGEKILDNERIAIDLIFNKLYLIYYTQDVEQKLAKKQPLPEEIFTHLDQFDSHKETMLSYEKYKYYTYLIFFTSLSEHEKIFRLTQNLIQLGKKRDFPTALISGDLYLATYYKGKHDSIKELHHLLSANNETKKIQYLYSIIWARYRLMDYYDHYQNYPLAKYWALKALFPPGTDYSNHFDIYGRLSNIYEKTGQIDSALYYKKIDYNRYKEISRTHDNNMESLLIGNMEKNIEQKESIIKRNYWVTAITFLGLLLVGYLLYHNRQINNKLTLQNKELEESYATLENFSHILSHDLKAPIRSINHLATFIEEDERNLSKEGKENLNLIKQSTNNTFILITNIMTYIHSRNKEIRKEHLVFEMIIQKAQDNLMEMISSNQALILYENLPKTIYGDRTLLIQLFQNLIQNSIKYRQKDTPPIINISFQQEKLYGIITIKDNGIGIKKEKLDTIFKAFTQENFVSPEQGVGLGLSICKNIINYHHGKIKAFSEKNSGTTINLYFPSNSF